MHTLTAIYRSPGSKEEFDTHYKEVHTPLARQMEGLRRMEVTWVDKMLTPSNDTLPAAPHLICTMYFDSAEALNASMKSPNSRAAAKDLMSFAGPLVSMITGHTEDIPL
ncbi:MAG: EthD family reductase [Bacteroidota bacterium]|nr:EthD family reductase [Bacteroidota bacterium]MDP4233844.1 EthD family reductase [Bacteroidota bacterium]MDP4242457.1 EthD family reductase [Bacteroidota bacterium]MDP4289045.1 EthD family reductase [Bacteroidota bacterium]